MSFFSNLALAATMAVAATAAQAHAAHMTDAQYLAAARCEGLMSSSELGRQDDAALTRTLRSEAASRPAEIVDRADEARESALNAVRHAGVYGRAALASERDGACRAILGEPSVATAAKAGTVTRTN